MAAVETVRDRERRPFSPPAGRVTPRIQAETPRWPAS